MFSIFEQKEFRRYKRYLQIYREVNKSWKNFKIVLIFKYYGRGRLNIRTCSKRTPGSGKLEIEEPIFFRKEVYFAA